MAVATVVESKMFPQSANGKLVVIMVDFLSCRTTIKWALVLKQLMKEAGLRLNLIAVVYSGHLKVLRSRKINKYQRKKIHQKKDHLPR